ncbi:3-isopropylmalate dehydratase large subunit [Lysobacter sp. H21R4]|uniref:aconitase/3-isopropylmalate dehydratase large subunit family protein n=1 Tax=Lysobacter sp. H21R4 TaxID=2781021 RepID=UPI0018890AFB|nr:aconitase/3-isopropylmalate dehydratase large subunit family protein [Lysobacter sp. H21R4]QOY62705.1 3-isopropylmalate dehydratase large subunit [Lysobacter sp. H21R4]
MAATLAEKIIAHACQRDSVSPGQIVTASLDLLMMHDSGGPRRVASRLEQLGAKVWDPDRVVVVSDHFVPATDLESAEILALTRRWAQQAGVRHYDMLGICHVVLQEGGHVQPGMFCVGGDSHSPSGGAYGAFMIGVGATDITGALVTGELWLKVPQTVRVNWDGALADGVSAKDIMLYLCATLGMGNENQAFEYDGAAVRAMSMSERMVLCNMSAELGAETGMVSADEKTLAALVEAGRPFTGDIARWQSDPEAACLAEHHYDAAALAPQIAAPHSPANSRAVTEYEPIHIDQGYIGACTGAKLSDLHMAAEVLKGRRIASNTRLLIAPASVAMTRQAAADGTLEILTEAGAIMLPTGCGACAGMGAGMYSAGEVGLSTTARNFKGRMGSAQAQVYLGSPYSVAAGAVKGYICDPRELLAEPA